MSVLSLLYVFMIVIPDVHSFGTRSCASSFMCSRATTYSSLASHSFSVLDMNKSVYTSCRTGRVHLSRCQMISKDGAAEENQDDTIAGTDESSSTQKEPVSHFDDENEPREFQRIKQRRDTYKVNLKRMKEKQEEKRKQMDKIYGFELDEMIEKKKTVPKLTKVSYISPGIHESSPELSKEEKLAELEVEKKRAVEESNFKKAEEKDLEMGRMHLEDCAAVLQLNTAFYRAFSKKAYPEMEEIWLKDSSVLCIHPGQKPFCGANEVMKKWAQLFNHPSPYQEFQQSWIEPTNMRVTVKGSTAVITCEEEVYARYYYRGQQKKETKLVSRFTATNIYRKVDNQWYMVHHHGSPFSYDSSTLSYLKNNVNDNSVRGLRVGAEGAGLGRAKKKQVPKKKTGAMDMDGNAISGGSIDGIESLDQLFGGNLGGNLGGGMIGKPKRIILSGGNLNDLKGGLSDMLKKALESDDWEEDNSGKQSIGGFMNDIEDADDFHDEHDEEHGKENDTYIDATAEPATTTSDSEKQKDSDNDNGVTALRKWVSDAKTSLSNPPKHISASKSANDAGSPTDRSRQSCISALRRLCNQGSISPKQKRLLLTDIITCSAKGEYSMVEVAYDLLCVEEHSDSDEKDVAEEEFADQCRVFATTLHNRNTMTLED